MVQGELNLSDSNRLKTVGSKWGDFFNPNTSMIFKMQEMTKCSHSRKMLGPRSSTGGNNSSQDDAPINVAEKKRVVKD